MMSNHAIDERSGNGGLGFSNSFSLQSLHHLFPLLFTPPSTWLAAVSDSVQTLVRMTNMCKSDSAPPQSSPICRSPPGSPRHHHSSSARLAHPTPPPHFSCSQERQPAVFLVFIKQEVKWTERPGPVFRHHCSRARLGPAAHCSLSGNYRGLFLFLLLNSV